MAHFVDINAQQQQKRVRQHQLDLVEAQLGDMAPILHMDSHQAHQVSWSAADNRHVRSGGQYAPQQHHQQQWPPGSQVHLNPMVLTRDVADDGLRAPVHGVGMGPGRIASMGRDVLGDPSLTGRGYSIKRCQGFVRCDMDIDAEVVGWVIGKNGAFVEEYRNNREEKLKTHGSRVHVYM